MEPLPEYCPPLPGSKSTAIRCHGPTPDLLYTRLEDMESGLRQLEERQRQRQRPARSDDYFASDLRRQVRPTKNPVPSSTTKEPRSKETLVDRLQLLESRISQLSLDLGKASTASAVPTVTTSTNEEEETRWLVQARPASEAAAAPGTLCHHTGGGDTTTSTDQVQGQKPKARDAKEKTVESVCRAEKRRMARTKLYKKWFPVGC